ncbi:MAG: LPS export ABC transporter permease LptF [Methylococcales bacterium]
MNLNYTTQHLILTGEMGLATDWIKNGAKPRRPWLTVLDKLIVLDILKTLFAVWSVIVVIIVSRKFISVLEDAVEGQISNETLLSILGFKTLVVGVSFLPVALFMAVLMVLGRMYRDQEMAAVSSAGGGSGTIYRAVMMVAVPLSLLAGALSLYASPWAEASIENLVSRDEQSSDLRGVVAGKFSEYSQGDLVFYVESISADKKMHKVFVQNRQHGDLEIINSESGHMQDLPDGRYVVLENGERVVGQPGDLNYVLENFVEYGVRLEEKDLTIKFNRAAVPTRKLWNSKISHDKAELQRRLSIMFGTLLLSFLAVPLAQISPRGGVYGNMLVGFLIYFSYGNLSRISQAWVVKGTMLPWLSGLLVNVILLLIGCVLLARLYGWQWLFLKVKGKVAR